MACSTKQRDLIEKIVRENNLDRREIDDLAKSMFDGVGVRQLNRLQASGLIDELLERNGGQRRHDKSPGAVSEGAEERLMIAFADPPKAVEPSTGRSIEELT